jgi:hypothetical protein
VTRQLLKQRRPLPRRLAPSLRRYILLGRTKGLLPEQPLAPAAAAAYAAAVAAGRGAVPAAQAGPAVILFDPWRDEELRRRWSLSQCLVGWPAGAAIKHDDKHTHTLLCQDIGVGLGGV